MVGEGEQESKSGSEERLERVVESRKEGVEKWEGLEERWVCGRGGGGGGTSRREEKWRVGKGTSGWDICSAVYCLLYTHLLSP